MAITVKHLKVSTIPDADDDALVRPSDWNADHALEGLGSMAEQNSDSVSITGGTITGVDIPASDITGLGTMATQDADDVAITGGNIENATGSNPDMSVGSANNLTGGEAGQIAVQTGEGVTGFTSTPSLDDLTFNPTPPPTTPGEGSVRYDETAKALIYYNSTNGNAITLGYNTQARVSNVTANTIYKGMIVYAKASASIGGAVQVEPAIATSYERSKVFGVATQDILPDEDGFVVTYGLVDGVDTSAWIQGTALYLSKEDEGEFTDEEVFSPDWTIHMGWVTKSLVDGQVFVKGENYSATPERFVGTLEVPNGGSGAVSLSGWLKGNGTAPFTAEDMIPLADIDGVGTMASQNADDVQITGGEMSGMDSIGTSDGGSITGDTLNINTLRPAGSGGIHFNTDIALTVYRLEGHDFIFEDNTNIYYTGNNGYVKANNTSPSTYSQTIPHTDITGSPNQVIYVDSTGVLTGNDDFTYDATNVTTANDIFVNGMRVGHGAANVLTNSVVGADSLESATTGANNTAFGYQALKNVTTGSNLTAFGYQAGYSSTNAEEFTAFGYLAAYSNTTGHGLSAFGYGAGAANTTGAYNSYIGGHAGQNNVGEYNTVVGGLSFYTSTAGDYNTIVGGYAAALNSLGDSNTSLGYYTLASSTGSGNVAIGAHAGRYETGSNAFYVNNQNRTNTAGDKEGSLMYGTFNATSSSQTLTINAATTVSNSLTTQSLVVNNNSTLGSSNTDTLEVNARITTDLEPNSNNAKDIGTSGRNWRDGFFGRTLSTVNLEVTGTASFDGQQGTAGQVLTSAGTGNTPTWTTPTTGSVTSITAGTGLTGGTITTSGTIAIDSTVVTTAGSYSNPSWITSLDGSKITNTLDGGSF